MINASYVEARDSMGEYLYQVFHHEMCWPVYLHGKWTTAWGGPTEWDRCGDSTTNGQKFVLPLYRQGKTRIFTELELSHLHVAEECPLYVMRREKSQVHYLQKRRAKHAKRRALHRRADVAPVGHAWRGHKSIFDTDKFGT